MKSLSKKNVYEVQSVKEHLPLGDGQIAWEVIRGDFLEKQAYPPLWEGAGHTNAYICQNCKGNTCITMCVYNLYGIWGTEKKSSKAQGVAGTMAETRMAECWSRLTPGEGSKGFIMHSALTLHIFEISPNKTFF